VCRFVPSARPRIHLNCAVSLDGRMAGADGRPLLLSDEEDLRRVHGLRATHDAILVGIGTVLADDPSLRVKPALAQGPDPLRVVLDTRGRTPPTSRVLDGSAPTLVITGEDVERDFAPAEHLGVPRAPGGVDLDGMLAALWQRGVRSVLVEGGGTVLRAFVEAGHWDRFSLYQAPVLVGAGPVLWPGATDPPLGLRVEGAERQGHGVLWRFAP
jgi:diaminohydroxyphosphoribosylaminopyrimidine deaminase/5-amino-6-(5-phosphoribosylamino)uracil reductase